MSRMLHKHKFLKYANLEILVYKKQEKPVSYVAHVEISISTSHGYKIGQKNLKNLSAVDLLVIFLVLDIWESEQMKNPDQLQ